MFSRMNLLVMLMAVAGFGIGAEAYAGRMPIRQAGSLAAVSSNGGMIVASAKDLQERNTGVQGSGEVILIGASYAAGLNMETVAGRRLINKGIGGEQSFETLARFDREVIALKPDAVILWGFINDIFRTEREKIGDALERIKSSYIAMIDKARENGIVPIVATEVTLSERPGFKAWVTGLIPRMLGKTSYQEYVNGHVMEINRWLKSYAREKGVIVLDFQALLADGGIMRKKAYSQKDGSHITEKGYAMLAEVVDANLKAIE